jgi:hypothetical protein
MCDPRCVVAGHLICDIAFGANVPVEVRALIGGSLSRPSHLGRLRLYFLSAAMQIWPPPRGGLPASSATPQLLRAQAPSGIPRARSCSFSRCTGSALAPAPRRAPRLVSHASASPHSSAVGHPPRPLLFLPAVHRIRHAIDERHRLRAGPRPPAGSPPHRPRLSFSALKRRRASPAPAPVPSHGAPHPAHH